MKNNVLRYRVVEFKSSEAKKFAVLQGRNRIRNRKYGITVSPYFYVLSKNTEKQGSEVLFLFI